MHQQHQQIATTLKNAWQNKNLAILQACLAKSLEWYEDPFIEPLKTSADVIKQWQDDLAKQTNIQVDITPLDSIASRAYYRCRASWRTETGQREVDGCFAVCLNSAGKITYFMQWWAAKN